MGVKNKASRALYLWDTLHFYLKSTFIRTHFGDGAIFRSSTVQFVPLYLGNISVDKREAWYQSVVMTRCQLHSGAHLQIQHHVTCVCPLTSTVIRNLK